MSEIIRAIESEQLKKDLPKFNVGDTLRVMVKVVEGDRERLQAFEGICIAKRNGSIRETFTLRRVSYGIGGFREGLTRAGGFECVGHCEIDKYANRSYNALFDTKGEWFIEDARKADPSTIQPVQSRALSRWHL